MADIKIALAIDSENPIVGDLYLENGTARLTRSLSEEVAQELYVRFRFFKGEWSLDPAQGLPYLQSILGKKTPIGIVSQIFRRTITSCPGVAALTAFQLRRTSTRGVSLDFTATLTDGTVLTAADFVAFVIPTPGVS